MLTTALTTLVLTTATPAPINITVAAPSSTGLTPAILTVIGVIVVAIATHYFTRNRSRQEWLRHQVFDVTKELNDQHRAYRNATERAPKMPSTHGTMTVRDLQRILDGHDWEPLDTAVARYMRALDEADILVTGEAFRDGIRQFRKCVELVPDDMKCAAQYKQPSDLLTRDEFDKRQSKTLGELDIEHRNLVGHMTYRYFTSFWTRIKNGVVAYANGKRRKRNRNKNSTGWTQLTDLPDNESVPMSIVEGTPRHERDR